MSRPITITVINKTEKDLYFADPKDIHGTKPAVTSGQTVLKPGRECDVFAKSKGTGTIGPEGAFKFEFQDQSGTFKFSYVHPYGQGTTSVNVLSPDGYKSLMEINNLQHHTAVCTISLRPEK